jgi:hypothetical protein
MALDIIGMQQAIASAKKLFVGKPATALNPGQLLGTDSAGNNAALNHQVAYACDLSGVATVIPTTGLPAYVNGVGIVAPVTARSVVLRWGGFAQITAAGAGQIALYVYETTTGTPVALAGSSIAGTFSVGAGSAFPIFPTGEVDLGPVTSERTFILAGLMGRDAASTLTASIRSSATGAVRAWIKAVAE